MTRASKISGSVDSVATNATTRALSKEEKSVLTVSRLTQINQSGANIVMLSAGSNTGRSLQIKRIRSGANIAPENLSHHLLTRRKRGSAHGAAPLSTQEMDQKKLKFHGTIQGHKFLAKEPDAFLAHIRSLSGEEVTVTVTKYRAYKQRSNDQNRYYWGVVIKLLKDETGHSPEELHEILKLKFLLKTYQLKDKQFPGVASTADLSTMEFEDLMAKIRSWASLDLGIYIPAPNEVPFEY